MFTAVLGLMMTGTLVAQQNVMTFLGIPIQGCRYRMTENLKEKGFSVPEGRNREDILRGEVLGNSVYLMIGTRDGEVCSIKLSGVRGCGKDDAKALFNRLCGYFETSENYLSISKNQTIPENEDISVGMSKKGKLYKAHFVQVSEADSVELAAQVEVLLEEKFGKDLKSTEEDVVEAINQYRHDCYLRLLSRKAVWFYITEFFNQYYINLFFENFDNASQQDITWF